MKISKGKIAGAKKTVLYGPEGIGKSTFASKYPEPVFIDTEGSTSALNVARFDEDFTDWNKINEAVDYALSNPSEMKTLVIDSVDWAENSCITYLNDKHGTDNILTMDYGRGSLFVVAEFEKLLDKLSKLIDKGVNVTLVAHAIMRKQELPDEMGAFDRWELKLQSKQVKAKVKEWADMVLFANYKTVVIEDSKTKSKKAQGGKRVMYTTHHPAWDAKNRYGLDDCIDFDYSAIKNIIEENKGSKKAEKKTEKTTPKPEEKQEKKDTPKKKEKSEVIKKLDKLLEENGIETYEVQLAVAKLKNCPYEELTYYEHYDEDFVQTMLIDQFDKMKKKILKMRESGEIPESIPFI